MIELKHGEEVPEHWLIRFTDAKKWRLEVERRGGYITVAPDSCWFPEGTLFAYSKKHAPDIRVMGVFYGDSSRAYIMKDLAGIH